MIVGVPKEIKHHEYRVGLTPGGATNLVMDGHRVMIERGVGRGSGFSGDMCLEAGAGLLPCPIDVFANAELVDKVKEPQVSGFSMLRPGLVLFTCLHLAGASRA